MKVIIAGTRTITSYKLVLDAIRESGFDITEVVSGTARGVDQLGEQYASIHRIPVKRFVPNWKEHSHFAGPIRNQEMAEYSDALILIWNGSSRGSANMPSKMRARKKPIYEKIVKG